jgi:hypothetical protein
MADGSQRQGKGTPAIPERILIGMAAKPFEFPKISAMVLPYLAYNGAGGAEDTDL